MLSQPKKIKNVKYLEFVCQIHNDNDIDTTSRIRTGWAKWSQIREILCDKQMPMKLMGKLYGTAVMPALLYGSEC